MALASSGAASRVLKRAASFQYAGPTTERSWNLRKRPPSTASAKALIWRSSTPASPPMDGSSSRRKRPQMDTIIAYTCSSASKAVERSRFWNPAANMLPEFWAGRAAQLLGRHLRSQCVGPAPSGGACRWPPSSRIPSAFQQRGSTLQQQQHIVAENEAMTDSYASSANLQQFMHTAKGRSASALNFQSCCRCKRSY